MPRGEDRTSDERRGRRQPHHRGWRATDRSPEGKRSRQRTADPEANDSQRVRHEQRGDGEWQLKREPDQEGGLEHQVVRDSAGPEQPLEMFLKSEADRRQEHEETHRRGRWSTSSQALADAEQQTGHEERQTPECERRRVPEIPVTANGVEPHVSRPSGGDEPVSETVRGQPGCNRQRQRDQPRGPVSRHNPYMIALMESAESRVRLLYALLDRERTVEELAGVVEMDPSAVSQQLRVLRQLRFVVAERVGRRRRYRLHDEHVAELLAAVRHHQHASRGWAAPPVGRSLGPLRRGASGARRG